MLRSPQHMAFRFLKAIDPSVLVSLRCMYNMEHGLIYNVQIQPNLIHTHYLFFAAVVDVIETRMERNRQDEIAASCDVDGSPNVMVTWYPSIAVYYVRHLTLQFPFSRRLSSIAFVNVSTCLAKASQISCIATATVNSTVIATSTGNFTLCGECCIFGCN